MQLSRAIVSALLAATAVVSSPVSESVQIIEVRKKKIPHNPPFGREQRY